MKTVMKVIIFQIQGWFNLNGLDKPSVASPQSWYFSIELPPVCSCNVWFCPIPTEHRTVYMNQKYNLTGKETKWHQQLQRKYIFRQKRHTYTLLDMEDKGGDCYWDWSCVASRLAALWLLIANKLFLYKYSHAWHLAWPRCKQGYTKDST